MTSQPNKRCRWLKAVPIAAMLICVTAFFLLGRALTYQELADWLPQNEAAASGLVILLYTVKSLTVVWPLLTLYLLSGVLFPALMAVLVNLLGLAAGMAAATILGGQITAPASPGFWAAAASGFAVALVSLLACRRTIKEERGSL